MRFRACVCVRRNGERIAGKGLLGLFEAIKNEISPLRARPPKKNSDPRPWAPQPPRRLRSFLGARAPIALKRSGGLFLREGARLRAFVARFRGFVLRRQRSEGGARRKNESFEVDSTSFSVFPFFLFFFFRVRKTGAHTFFSTGTRRVRVRKRKKAFSGSFLSSNGGPRGGMDAWLRPSGRALQNPLGYQLYVKGK